MKIELNDEHFGVDLTCPNCDADISIPDVNKVAEEKERLAKEIEELKNDSKFTQTNTITMGRPGQTLKVNAAAPAGNEAELLKKEKELNAKLKKEEEVLSGKLKGLQAANMSMNVELTQLKEQKAEFKKSIDTIKDLQRKLDEKEKEAETLKNKLDKYSQITQNLKEISTVGQVDVQSDAAFEETMVAKPEEKKEDSMAFAETMVAEPDEEIGETKVIANIDACFAETMVPPSEVDLKAETIAVSKEALDEIGKDKFDQTLQVTMDAVKVTERECSNCGVEYVYTAKFCPKCKTRNESYTD